MGDSPRLPFGFLEFFSGAGMARIGLGSRWQCLFANDICPKKASAYSRNFGSPPDYAVPELVVKDVGSVTVSELPDKADLVWASFPCQDLSLAGNGAGLQGSRSGTFWPFWDLMQGLDVEGRKPPLVVLENVTGAITSNSSRDFKAIIDAFVSAKYRVGALVIDAVFFVPQSRPRLFVVAVDQRHVLPPGFQLNGPHDLWHPRSLRTAHASLPPDLRSNWVWWKLPAPGSRRKTLSQVVEPEPTGVKWHSPEETRRLLSMMSPANLQKVEEARKQGTLVVGTVYRRTRPDGRGGKVQRAEVRFDQVCGCLRTPAGGSSRQTIILVEGRRMRTRLLSPRETARAMGVPDWYQLPSNYNDAYHLMGDGVVVPVVRFLERTLLRHLVSSAAGAKAA